MMNSLDEVTILPCDSPSKISSRSLVNPFDDKEKLPIFVSPMTCVINKDNYNIFRNSKVIPIIPRGVSGCITDDSDWIAYSLLEFEKCIKYDLNNQKLLIDVANGHMEKIYDLVKHAKSKWPSVTIMVGNIAHPGLYLTCCQAGVDYVRVGIGGGNGCSTSSQTGIHASLPWLLKGIKEVKNQLMTQYFSCSDLPFEAPFFTKIIADGGIDTIAKAIKCLALGADYIMMGKTFAQCEEACGKVVNINGKLYREYYGMASEKGQRDISEGVLKNPEGIVTVVPITTTLSEYCNKFEAVLRSAMSYTDCWSLEEFKTKAQTDIQSIYEFKAFDK